MHRRLLIIVLLDYCSSSQAMRVDENA